jgi:hypothetical protein
MIPKNGLYGADWSGLRLASNRICAPGIGHPGAAGHRQIAGNARRALLATKSPAAVSSIWIAPQAPVDQKSLWTWR